MSRSTRSVELSTLNYVLRANQLIFLVLEISIIIFMAVNKEKSEPIIQNYVTYLLFFISLDFTFLRCCAFSGGLP